VIKRRDQAMAFKKPDAKKEQAEAEAPAEGELQAFDKRRQIKEKPKKEGGFGKRKPAAKAETEKAAEEARPAGTFFKVPKAEKVKKPGGFGTRKK
jgi:hypothetical protein